MFDIRIEKVNYFKNNKYSEECPIIKAEVLIRDEDNFMLPTIKRIWEFDVHSYANYANKDNGAGVGAIELIIEEIVKKMWTVLHAPIPKKRAVCIDMYLPMYVDSFDMSYMNELFTKYLTHERFRDAYARELQNCYMIMSRGSGKWEAEMKMLENYIKTGKVEILSNMDISSWYPKPDIPRPLRQTLRQTFIDDTLLDIYPKVDVKFIEEMFKDGIKAKEKIKEYEKMQIEDVIFNEPATIVFWRDGSKTVVKAQDGEPFDPEKGLAMAIAKKTYGNKYDYYNTIKHWTKRYKPKEDNKNE